MNKRFLSILSIVLCCSFLTSCGEKATQDSLQTIESSSNVNSDTSLPDENYASEDISFQTVTSAESFGCIFENPEVILFFIFFDELSISSDLLISIDDTAL